MMETTKRLEWGLDEATYRELSFMDGIERWSWVNPLDYGLPDDLEATSASLT
jgi:hypothetical protein